MPSSLQCRPGMVMVCIAELSETSQVITVLTYTTKFLFIALFICKLPLSAASSS
jgi:hypothetical protein